MVRYWHTNQPVEAIDTMSDLQDDLKSFHRFAEMKLEASGYESLEELLGLWRANHPLARKPANAKPGRGKPADAGKPEPPGKSAVPYL
jgi:hypothetical protein